MGAALTALAVEAVGTDNLLLVSAAILGLCVALVAAIVRRQQIQGDFASVVDERGVGGGEAIRLLRSSRHLQVIALVIGFAAIGAAIIEQQLNMAAESLKGAGSTDAITGFLAQVTFYLSIVGFVVQVGLTSRIHRSLGLAFALLILPVSLGTTAMIILLNGALWAPAAAVSAATGRPEVSRQAICRRDDGPLREGAGGAADPRAHQTVGAAPRLAASELREPGGDGPVDRHGDARPS